MFLLAGAIYLAFAPIGCIHTNSPAPQAQPSGAAPPIAQPVQPTDSAPPKSTPANNPGVVIEPDRRASVANPIYHPGTSQSLSLSGKFEGTGAVTFSGSLTQIVTRENREGKPVHVMNWALELEM